MAPKQTKGAGKGSAAETWEQRRDRLIAEETAINKQQAAAASRLSNHHAKEADWKLVGSGGKPAKGQGKGQKGQFAKTNQANVVTQQTAKQLASAADAALQAAADRMAARDAKQQSASDRAATNTERNRIKKEKREADRAAQGPRLTQLCMACTFNGTYQTSTRCYSCKTPFTAPPVPTPVLAAPSPAVPTVISTTSTAAVQALDQIRSDSAARLVTFAQVIQTPIATPQLPVPPPPPPSATGGPAAVSPAVVVPPSAPAPTSAGAPLAVATPAQTTPAAPTPDMVASKQLIALRAELAKAEVQKAAFLDVPTVLGALTARAADLEAQITAIITQRQQDMEPHQIAAMLSQRQLELGQATQAAADLDSAANARMVTFDTHANAINDNFTADIKALLAAQEAAAKGFVEERKTLWTSLNTEVLAARAKVASLQKLVSAAETANLRHNGAVQSAAQHAAAAAAASAATVAAAAAREHETLRLQLVAQQEALAKTKAALDAQAAALCAQQQTLQPSAIRPMATLPPAVLPTDPVVARGLYALRQSLLTLAQQDSVVLVTWANLASSALSWDECTKLVPAAVIGESVALLDHIIGPEQDAPVPRRVLELIRAQLDALAADWLKANAEEAAKAELGEQVRAWSQATLDQAKRLVDRKRPADTALEAARVAPSAAANLGAPAPSAAPQEMRDIDPTQLDATQSPAEQSSQPLPVQSTPPTPTQT